MSEAGRVFHCFRLLSKSSLMGPAKLIAELFMWNSRIPDVVSGPAFTSLFNHGYQAFTSNHHAAFEYGGTLASLPEGKSFESPDKTLNHFRFWFVRPAANT
jgi:hypothetical protein